MPRRTTERHPPDQLYLVARAWFLEVIRTDCPDVLDDLWREAYAPLMLALPQSAAVALLRRQLPQGQHFPPGFPQRCVYEGIERWAQRWNLNTSWIREQAWRTLSFWAANPKLPMGTPVRSTDPADHVVAHRVPVRRQVPYWAPVINTGSRLENWAPVINTGSRPGRRTSREVSRARDHVKFVWFVRHRVCRPPTPLKELAAGAGATNRNVSVDTVRVGVNRVAPMLDLPVPPRGRPRKKR